jgi:hypothetical protein
MHVLRGIPVVCRMLFLIFLRLTPVLHGGFSVTPQHLNDTFSNNVASACEGPIT